MAAAPHAGAAPDGCIVRALRPPRTGNQHTTPHKPNRKRTFPALDDLPPGAGVKLVCPRRCATPAAQLDPWPRGGKTRAAARKDPEEQSAHPDGARSHRATSVCPLELEAPMGAAMIVDQRRRSCRCGLTSRHRRRRATMGLGDGTLARCWPSGRHLHTMPRQAACRRWLAVGGQCRGGCAAPAG
jgi:hypothetical protein